MDYPESESFRLVAPHYDTLMAGVPYDFWLRYLKKLLKINRAKPATVLDLACGTGNLTELLSQSKYQVTGVDISADMIRVAKLKAQQSSQEIEYYIQDAADMDLDGKTFDLVVSVFDSLNYITDPSKLQAAVKRVEQHLNPGGLFIFDVNSCFALQNNFFDQDNMYEDEALRYVWRSQYDPDTRICTINMRFFSMGPRGVDEEFREVHRQFAYTETELRDMLIVAGFKKLDTYRAYTLDSVTPTTDRIFFVAAKHSI